MQHISYRPLIDTWEDYLKSDPKPTLDKFANYILMNSAARNDKKKESWMDGEMDTYFEKNTTDFKFNYSTPVAATLIWRLHKFIRIYTKPIIQEYGLASNDQFAILATVDARKQCSKKAAIHENLIELTTGVDMIKRLVSQGYLFEKPNKEDKREMLISLTPKGKKLLYSIYQKFATIQDVLGDLNEKDRTILVKYLHELDFYHTNLEPGVK